MTPATLITEPDQSKALDATTAALGLVVEPEWREAVLLHMRVIGAAAQLLLEFPLDDEIEAAPIFRP